MYKKFGIDKLNYKNLFMVYILFRFVEIVMSSLSCLNGSFLMLNDSHYSCSGHNHGIDFDLAAQCFDAISHVRNTSLSDLVSIIRTVLYSHIQYIL